MSDQSTACGLGVTAILVALWGVGCVGNRSEWMKEKCNSPSTAYTAAKQSAADSWAERKAAAREKRAAADREELAKRREAETAAERAKREAEERARLEEIKRKQERQERLLREFAIKESPVLWQSVVQMRKDIGEQDVRIVKLERTITDMGEDPSVDEDCLRLRQQRTELQAQLKRVMEKIKEAYIKSVKYETALGHKELQNFNTNASEHGADEADAAGAKYDKMRMEK